MTTDYADRLQHFLPTPDKLEAFAGRRSTRRLLKAFSRITTWFRLIQDLRGDQQTSVLISAAHSKIIEIWILVPLGLFHSSYSALRTVVDICTSYTFYSSHPVEWLAICEERAGWESRAQIIDWHIRYTPNCRELNTVFGWAERLNEDYQALSSYVHGIPLAGLPTLDGIVQIELSERDVKTFTSIIERIDYDISLFFLGIFHRDLALLSREDIRTITRGIDHRRLAKAGIVLPKA